MRRGLTAKERASRVTAAIYAKRIIGDATMPIPMPIYTGPFDCEYIASSVPLPDGKKTAPPYDEHNPNPDFRSHQRAWGELWRRFETAWAEHERSTVMQEMSTV